MSDEVQVEETLEEEEIKFEPVGDRDVVEEGQLTDDQAEKILLELKTGEKFFEYEGVKYKVVLPSIGEVQEADFEYAKTFTRAIKAGLPTRDSLERELVSRDILPDIGTFEAEADVRREDIRRLEVKLKSAEKSDNKKLIRKYATELTKLRAESYTSVLQRSAILGNSAETKAEETRTSYLMTKSVFHADTMVPVWSKYSDYLAEHNHRFVNAIISEYMTFTTGLTMNFLDEFPEAKALENLLE